ncbi:Gag-Pol polyprotein, partial [Nosema granulosis]
FTLRTDHRALTYLWQTKTPGSRLMRWSLKLSEYSFNPEYIKGEDNIADGLSRIPEQKEKSVNSVRTQPIPDETTRNEILKQHHLALGHGSPNAMKYVIAGKYNWEGMYKDIMDFVGSCEICLKGGGALRKTKNRVIMSTRPNELWEVDLVGPLIDEGRSKYILTAIDHYSKWLETRTLEGKSSKTLVGAIKDIILKKHGTPTRILSDNGLEFDNKDVRELTGEYGFEWVFSSPYHHQTVGAIERVNQSLMNHIKKLTDFGRDDWVRHVGSATFAVNVSYNRSIGCSPYVFRFGKHPELEIDKTSGVQQPIIPKDVLIKTRDEHFKKYAKDIVKGKVDIKRTLKIGDRVLIFREAGTDKLEEKWNPGFVITDRILPDAYMVRGLNSNRLLRVNKGHIKLDTANSR